MAVSPYAKKLAAEAGIVLPAAGSGPGGRVTSADVQQLIASGGAAAAAGGVPAAAGAAAAVPSGGYTDLEVNNIKKVTAARLLESKLTIPHYYLTMECQVCWVCWDRGRCQVLRAQIAGCGACWLSGW